MWFVLFICESRSSIDIRGIVGDVIDLSHQDVLHKGG